MDDPHPVRLQASRHLTRRRFLLSGAAAGAAGLAGKAYAGSQPAPKPAAVAPLMQQTTPTATAGGPSPGPNLLATTWPERLGVQVSELQPATGQPILNPQPGDIYFFSNSSTTWGATNTKNGVWVVNAKTYETVAEVAPPDGEGASSHGIAVSGDGKYIYLPMLGQDNHVDVLDGRTFEVVQTIRTLGRPHHWKLWHDPVSNKDLIIGEDFNWSFQGSGVYVFDPSQDNAVVGGMSNGDFEGNPYVTTPAPDGSFIVVTVPAPTPALRDEMDGYVAKVDPTTWKVVGMTPMKDPIWAEVSLDGKYAYVTSGGEARVHKINLETMEDEGFVQTGPGPWGARISYDQTKLYTADKGEGPGYNQQGRTSTIIDLATMGVLNAVLIGLTTDHAILSPDGTEIWFTSNADHDINVLDTTTDEIKTVIKDPGDGDIHGGVFVMYSDDGNGGVKGEVVADYSGLHGSALAAQLAYVAQPQVTIAVGRQGFLQTAMSVDAGVTYRLTLKNTGGTSTGTVTVDAPDLGITGVSLKPGQSTELSWTAPAQPGDYKLTTNKAPNNELTLTVTAPAPAETPTATTAGGPREIDINAKGFAFDVTEVRVKASETVRFVITNGDDEKHNIVGLGDANLLSPDVSPGQTVTYDWTAPAMAGQYTVICAYHPKMTFTLIVES